MKTKSDQHIEDMVDRIMKEVSLDTPSLNFTSNVMMKVDTLMKPVTIVYKPLISKRSWVFVMVAIVGLICYFMLTPSVKSSGWFSNIDFSVVSNNILTNTISSLKLSRTAFYAIIMLSVMLIIQIPILKNYFNSRLEF